MTWNQTLEPVDDDGLLLANVRSWAQEKHRLLAHYAAVFAISMRRKWDTLVYLDLFAGPGRCKLKGTNRIYLSSPTVVLGQQPQFTRYVFCDSNPQNVQALSARVARDYRSVDTKLLTGNANCLVPEILERIPKGNRKNKVLSLCFLDPYQLSNLKFSTIKHLSERFIDFLGLIPSGMDANRNELRYLAPHNTVLDEFFGNSDWRMRWREEKLQRVSFERFVTEEFSRSMKSIEYIDPRLENSHVVRSDEKNLLLYRLVLYSRHTLGKYFWEQTRKYTDTQTSWDF